MKFLLLILLLPFFSSGQITIADKEEMTVYTKIGEVKPMGKLLAYLQYGVSGKDTAYVLMFRNGKYTTLVDFVSIEFENIDNTLDKFYNILMSVFLPENRKNKEYKVTLRLGDTDIILLNHRLMGATYAMIWTDDGYIYLTEKQVNTLFGK